MTIILKSNDANSANAAVNTITNILNSTFKFPNEIALIQSKKNSVISSLEITNEEPIVGSTEQITTEELKQRAKGYYTTPIKSRHSTRLRVNDLQYAEQIWYHKKSKCYK